MTKCIVLGEQPTEVKKKPIEFIKALSVDDNFHSASSAPKKYENIELITKSYASCGQDVMFAYDRDRSLGCLYIGKWNDGVAE